MDNVDDLPLNTNDLVILYLLMERLAKHDHAFPSNRDSTREGVRAGITSVEDKIYDLLDEWRREKRTCDWDFTTQEAINVLAVAWRLLRALVADVNFNRSNLPTLIIPRGALYRYEQVSNSLRIEDETDPLIL